MTKIDRPLIVCLCGSTRFMDAFFEVGWKFTLDGWIVLSVGVCKHGPADHAGEFLGLSVCKRLDELHKRKIDLCDEVFILDVNHYIGDSTRSEIEYAKGLGKPIKYLSQEIPDYKESIDTQTNDLDEKIQRMQALLERWVKYYTSKSTVAARCKLFQDTKTLLKEIEYLIQDAIKLKKGMQNE